MLQLNAIGCELLLADVYARIAFPAQSRESE